MSKKWLGISILILIALIASSGIYIIVSNALNYDEKVSQHNNQQIEPETIQDTSSYDYYENLKEKCKLKSSVNCCLASVDSMQKIKAKAIGDSSKCKKGYKKETLLCVDSYHWCKKDKSLNTNPDKDNTVSTEIMSIEELINSKKHEGEYVEVYGNVGSCVELKVRANYEGLPSGCRIHDKTGNTIVVDMGLLNFQKEENIIIGGEVKYCGGKKRKKYICSIVNAKILDKKNNLETGTKNKNPFKEKKGNNVVCAQDVKKCPNGSFVKREGPKCNFQKCYK